MKRRTLLGSLAATPFLSARGTAEPEVRVATTPCGVRFGIWGAAAGAPAPAVFVFDSTIEATLGQAYYRQSANTLSARGCLAVSLDLPCHGGERRADEPEGLAGWRARAERGAPFMEEFAARARQVLDHLVEQRVADPGRIAACGTSRGGYSALQLAARERRVRCVAAFAPLTDPALISEFRGAESLAAVRELALARQAEALAGRGVWIVIGDRDARVGTDAAIALARRITAASLEKGLDAAVELHVMPEPHGHTTPAGSAELAAVWIARQLGI